MYSLSENCIVFEGIPVLERPFQYDFIEIIDGKWLDVIQPSTSMKQS